MDKTVRLWGLATGQEQTRLDGHQDEVTAVAFSGDGKILASGSSDKTVRLWGIASGQERARLEGHQKRVSAVTFSPDGKIIASGSWDKTVRLWDLSTHQERGRLKDHLDQVSALAFSPDGKTLASGTGSLAASFAGPLAETAKGVAAGTVTAGLLLGESSAVITGLIGGLVAYLAVDYRDNSVRIWDPITGLEQDRLKSHLYLGTPVAFSTDGKILASGSWDHTIRLWDLTSGQERARLKAIGRLYLTHW